MEENIAASVEIRTTRGAVATVQFQEFGALDLPPEVTCSEGNVAEFKATVENVKENQIRQAGTRFETFVKDLNHLFPSDDKGNEGEVKRRAEMLSEKY